MRKFQKGFVHPEILVVIILIAIVGVFFFVFQNQSQSINSQPSPTPTLDTDGPVAAAGVDISNWKTYRNEEHGFQFRYPKHLVLEDFRNGPSLSFGDATGLNWEDAFWMKISVSNENLNQYLQNNPCEGKVADAEWPKKLYEACVKTFDDNKEMISIAGENAICSIWNPYEHPSVINIFEHNSRVYDIRHTQRISPKGSTWPTKSSPLLSLPLTRIYGLDFRLC